MKKRNKFSRSNDPSSSPFFKSSLEPKNAFVTIRQNAIIRSILVVSSSLIFASCSGTTDKPTELSQIKPSGETWQIISYESANGIGFYADIFKGRSFESQILNSRLYLPATCSEPGKQVPAVIIQHGSGRPGSRWYWELPKRLNEAGIAALVANSYSKRWIQGTGRDQTILSTANRVYDAFAAFRALQDIPCIDADRIGITGYSYGGIISREAVESALADRLGAGHVFKASLPVYPGCKSRWEISKPTNTKVHFLLAGRDDYTPAKFCIEQIPQLKSAGWDVSYSVHPDAHHGLIGDQPYRYDPSVFTAKNCPIFSITADGYLVNKTLGIDTRNMTWRSYIGKLAKSCATRGASFGRHNAARTWAMDFTVQFFSEYL